MVFKHVEMETMWETVESCIVSVITLWNRGTATKQGRDERIKTEYWSTTKEALYIETRLPNIK